MPADRTLDEAAADELAIIMENSMINVTSLSIPGFEYQAGFLAVLVQRPGFWQRLRDVSLSATDSGDVTTKLEKNIPNLSHLAAMALPELEEFILFSENNENYLPSLVPAPWWGQLKKLCLRGGKSLPTILSACRKLTSLSIRLSEDFRLDKELGAALAQLKHLRHISVCGNYTHEGVEELIKAEWKNLQNLQLVNDDTKQDHFALLGNNAQWELQPGAKLFLTSYADDPISASTLKTLAASSWFRCTGFLCMPFNDLDYQFAAVLARTPMPHLTRLNLAGNTETSHMSSDGIRALAAATSINLKNIEHVDISWHYDDELYIGFEAFAKGKWEKLTFVLFYDARSENAYLYGLEKPENAFSLNAFQDAFMRAQPEKWGKWKFGIGACGIGGNKIK